MGVHLTFLRPDGNDKAGGVEDAKLTVCKGSTGSPICLAPPNHLLGFSVTEGIEDALPIHEATGLGVWPGRPVRQDACRRLAPDVPDYLDTATVVVDADPYGRSASADGGFASRCWS